MEQQKFSNVKIIGVRDSHTVKCTGICSESKEPVTFDWYINYNTFECCGSKCRVSLHRYTNSKGPHIWCRSCHDDEDRPDIYDIIIECCGNKCRHAVNVYDNTSPLHCNSCYDMDDDWLIEYAASILPDFIDGDDYNISNIQNS